MIKKINLYCIFVVVISLATSCKTKDCDTKDFIGTLTGTWENKDAFTCPANLITDFTIVESTTSDFGVLFMHTEKDSLIYKVDLTGPNEQGCTIETSNFPAFTIDGIFSKNNLQMSFKDKDGNITCTYNGTINN